MGLRKPGVPTVRGCQGWDHTLPRAEPSVHMVLKVRVLQVWVE